MLFIETMGSRLSREVSWGPPSSGPEAPTLSYCHFKVSIPLEIAMLPPVGEGARGEGVPGGRVYFPEEVWPLVCALFQPLPSSGGAESGIIPLFLHHGDPCQ